MTTLSLPSIAYHLWYMAYPEEECLEYAPFVLTKQPFLTTITPVVHMTGG